MMGGHNQIDMKSAGPLRDLCFLSNEVLYVWHVHQILPDGSIPICTANLQGQLPTDQYNMTRFRHTL